MTKALHNLQDYLMKHNIMLKMLSTVENVNQNLETQAVLKLMLMPMLDIVLCMVAVFLSKKLQMQTITFACIKILVKLLILVVWF